jgi:YbbR domain-containing protein
MVKMLRLIALIFLLFVSCTDAPVETNLLLYVDYLNIPNDMVLASFNTDKIEIRIRARPNQIKKLNNADARYPVDLYTDIEFDPVGASDSIEPGTYLIPVYTRRLPMSRSIRILNIKPYYLSVRLEKKVSKIFQVKVLYTGTPAQGYRVLETLVEPSGIELTGPASYIGSISDLHTKPVDLANANENFKRKIPLDLEGLPITASPDSVVTVTVNIEQQHVSHTIENIPILAKNSSLPVKIKPSKISINILGPYETVNNEEILNKIEAFIDVKKMKPGVHKTYASISIPAGLIMTDASPQVFSVNIKHNRKLN